MSATLKPRLDPLLWAQLRPSVISARKAGGEDASQTLSATNVPLVPENRIATSLRVVLHDTKSVMEQFSDKLNNLLCDVDKTRRQIDKTNDSFENAHEKVLEELVATVNRCQKGLLEVLENPAQASDLNEVKASQIETAKKMEQFTTRVDTIQNSLQSILEQQGQILTCLGSLTPMAAPLQDVPNQLHHIASQLSLMQPLYQSLPDQLKLTQHEISKQSIQAIHDAYAASSSSSTEKNLESFSRVVSESLALINATLSGKHSPQDSSTSQNLDRTVESKLRSESNCFTSRQDINTDPNQDISMMMLRPQGGQGGTDTNSSLGESDDPMSCPSGPRKTCSEQESERSRLVNATARNKTAKNTSTPKRKSKATFHSTTFKTGKKTKSNSKARDAATSDRVLRSQICQPETALFSKRGDKLASLLNESFSSINPIIKTSAPRFIGSYDESSPKVPAPLPKRRMLLPPNADQQMDFELDWGSNMI